MTHRILAGVFLACLLVSPLRAADPRPADTTALDKLVVDTLREVHNKGADLYNTNKDFAGTYRLYQGALLTVRPLLAQHAAAQKLIDDGLAEAEKEVLISQKAFRLHETIEGVRAYLKTAIEVARKAEEKKPETKKPAEVTKTPETKKPETKTPDVTKNPEVKKPETKMPETKTPETKKPAEVTKTPETKKPVEVVKKPEEPKKTEVAIAPSPKSKEPGINTPTSSKGTTGKVMLGGKPIKAGEVTFVTTGKANPRVFTATLHADGTYSFDEALPAGKYVVTVNGKGIPDKFHTTTTSGLTFEVKAGTNNYDIDLK
jgi:outer membrane biosynthesis protein TonB